MTQTAIRPLKVRLGLSLLTAGLALSAAACGSNAAPEAVEVGQPPAQSEYRILWIDSYHAEYEWSAEIEEGLRSVLEPAGVEYEIHRMDTKRNTGDTFLREAADRALAAIEEYRPDAVIATDDNAQRHLVVPHLDGGDVPVVFAGVNWSVSEYGYPTPNVTGMIEVDLVDQLVDLLSASSSGTEVGYLTGDSETERKLFDVYNSRFFDGALVPVFVSDFDTFKQEFVAAQERFGYMYVANNAAIEGWDPEAAEAFVLEHTRIPTGTHNAWMAPYVMVAVAKYGQEQGEWAASTALAILDGTPIADIPVTTNERGRLIANVKIADRLGVVLSPAVLRSAELIGVEVPS